MHQAVAVTFRKVSFISILALCALLPIFFLPGTWSGLAAVKGLILYIAVAIGFSSLLLAQFVEGRLELPRHRAYIVLGAWLGLALVGALTSANVRVSLWGRGFVIDSFATTLALGLFTFLIAIFAREQKKLVKLFLATLTGSVLTILLQVVLYVSQKTALVSTYLAHVASQGTLVGTWIDFAYFVTFTLILSLLMHEVLAPKGFFKILTLVSIVLSLGVLVFLNFKIAWIITILAALLVFVYKSSVERTEGKKARFAILSFSTLIIGLLFFLTSASLGSMLAQKAGVVFSDLRPSLRSSLSVAGSTLHHDPLFGIGAGRYSAAWNLYHPLEANTTNFWNASFDGGYSLFITTLTTSGVLTTLALLVLLGMSVVHGFSLFGATFPDRFSRFIAVASLIMLLAFVGLFMFASPGFVLIVYGCMYLGLLLGVSSLVKRTEVRPLNYLKDPRSSFFVILILILATLAGLASVYFSSVRFASIAAYNHALRASTVEAADASLQKALSLSPNDIYWRTRSALYVKQFSSEANSQSPDKTRLQQYFSGAEESARAAARWDPTDASNWLGLSQVYQLAAAANNKDAYQNAKTALDEAQKRSPLHPALRVQAAQLALTQGDTAGALEYLDQAVALKVNYLDAYILRGQIKGTLGETDALQKELTLYTQTAPFDPQGYTVLGQTELAAKRYQAALDAFTRSAQLAPASPEPLLGAINALVALGERDRAIAELRALGQAFPGVTGIEEKIQELQTPVAPPADTKKKQ